MISLRNMLMRPFAISLAEIHMRQPAASGKMLLSIHQNTPRELIDNNGRVIPGDGNAPVVAILKKLAEKQYRGALSVELFLMELVQGAPFDVASRIKQKCERVMREAGVL